MPLRWRKLENFKLELPRDTLLSVEVVQELKGEVRGERSRQRKFKNKKHPGSVLSNLSFLPALIIEVFTK